MVASLVEIMNAMEKNIGTEVRNDGLIVNKPRYVVHIKAIENKLTAHERRLYNTFLYYAKMAIEKLRIESPMELEFAIKNKMLFPFRIPLGVAKAITRETKKDRLIKHLKNMHSTKVEYNILRKDKKITPKMDVIEDEIKVINEERNIVDYQEVSEWGEDSLIISPKVNFDKNVVTYYLPFQVLQLLYKPSMYVNVNILTTSFFDTPYAIALYEYLLDIFKIKTHTNKKFGGNKHAEFIDAGIIDKASLFAVLGIDEKKYKTFKDFRKWVLQPSIDKINTNELTEFIIEDVVYEREQSRGRGIKSIRFILKERKVRKKAIFKNNTIEIVAASGTELPHNILLSIKSAVEEGKMDYIGFKQKLQKTPNADICNLIDGYDPHFILRTSVAGMLELYNPQEDQVYELDSTEAAKLKEWLFSNPQRIGDIRTVSIKDMIDYLFKGKYIIASKRGNKYIKTVYQIIGLNGDEDAGIELVLKDIINGEIIEDGMKTQGKDPNMLKNILSDIAFDKSKLERKITLVQAENDKTLKLLEQQKKSKIYKEYFSVLEDSYNDWIAKKKKEGGTFYKILIKNAEESTEGKIELFYNYYEEEGKKMMEAS